MTKPLHVRFLDLFAGQGIGRYVNIAPFIGENFVFTTPLNRDLPVSPGAPVMFLKDLIQRGWVVPEQEDINHWVLSFTDGKLVPRTKDSDEKPILYFSITSKGIDYLDAFNASQVATELNKSYINVNEASLRNYRSQRNFSIVTVILAAVSALFSYFGYNKTDETAIALERLRQDIRQWQMPKSMIQNQKSFETEFRRKHRPFVLDTLQSTFRDK